MQRWSEFLRDAAPSGHAVQVYADAAELTESVAAYLTAGFELGQPAVVVATPEHLEGFAAALAGSGWDAAKLEREGLLEVADAETTLAAFMDGERPSRRRFEEVVGGLIDGAASRLPGTQVRAFGEMVDVLHRRGQLAAAISLEALWSELARTRSFSLLCAYGMDIFDRAAQVEPLPHVCRAHTHVLPAREAATLSRAVDTALEEVLGPNEAGQVYALVGHGIREGRVPTAQLILMWVSENLPTLADRILASARAHYVRAAAT